MLHVTYLLYIIGINIVYKNNIYIHTYIYAYHVHIQGVCFVPWQSEEDIKFSVTGDTDSCQGARCWETELWLSQRQKTSKC